MSRAIHKMRGTRPDIELIASDYGNVGNNDDQIDFLNISVGAQESGKILICAISHASDSASISITAITADQGGQNIIMTEVVKESANSSDTNDAMIYIADISAVTASTITIRCNATGTKSSWGLSSESYRNLISQIPTDTGTDTESTGNLVTTTTLDGQRGGVIVGCAMSDRRGNQSAIWGSLTEKADLQTGGGGHDHTHTAAFDLLPSGRSAATESVTWQTADARTCVVVAAFR